jgi:hypothetical protein
LGRIHSPQLKRAFRAPNDAGPDEPVSRQEKRATAGGRYENRNDKIKVFRFAFSKKKYLLPSPMFRL